MRIVHYIPSIDRLSGGVGAYMQLLAKPLGKLVELHIVTHASENELVIDNAEMHYMPHFMHGMRKAWEQALDDLQPDVVHVNGCWLPGSAFAQRWAQAKGYKVVLTPHGMLEPWIIQRHYWTKKWPALMLYQQAAVQRADMLHATAESEKKNLLRLGYNDKITVIPNGIAVDSIAMKSSWKRTGKILFLSRVHVKKGINFLLEAFAKLDNTEGLTLQIAGEGDAAYVNELKTLANSLGIADKVEFLGGVYGEEKWQLFREADLFVLPTYSENFGIVVGEALASGTPVITTTGTPWSDLNEYHCGWQTEVGTQPTLDALNSFMKFNEKEIEAMGRRGRKLIEDRYSDTFVAQQMVEMYGTLSTSHKY